jgi:proline iminopeptidase
VQTRTLERFGARLVYDVIGHGSPMIVIPGGPGFGSGYLRNAITSALSAGRQLTFIDQRGSGRSTGHTSPEHLTVATFVEDLEAVRANVAADRVDLLGHSFGGLQALHYVLAYPHRLRNLLLVDADPPTFEEWNRFREVLAARRTPAEVQLMQALQSRDGWEVDPSTLETYYRIYLRPYFARPERASTLTFEFGRDAYPKLMTTGPAVRQSLGQWNLVPALARVTTPALIVYGRHTIFADSAPATMKAALTHARLEVLESAGHFPFIEAPDVFQRVVLDFLTGC